VQHRGVIGPIGHAEQGVVLSSDFFHVVDEGLEAVGVGLVAPAVPPLEVVHSPINVVGDGLVWVDLHDAVQEEIPAQCRERPSPVPLNRGLVDQRQLCSRRPRTWGNEFNAMNHVQSFRINASLRPKPREGRHQVKMSGVQMVGAY